MSYNFNPQPSFNRQSGGLSTASMHTVTPPTISSPFSIVGTYQLGAVRLSQQAQLSGSSALNGTGNDQFTKAVISFWARFDSTVSPTGSNAVIIQARGKSGGPAPTSDFTQCSASDPISGGIPIQNLGIMMGPTSLNLYLMDGVTRTGLLEASLNWVVGNCNFSPLQWVNMGPWSKLIQPPPPGPGRGNGLPGSTYYNGRYWNGSFWAGFFPCADVGTFIIDTTGAAQLPQYNSVADLPDPNLPPFLAAGSVYTGGPISGSIYDTPADEYAAQSFPIGGGTPTTGWHHYICSFDTSQIVNDQFGSPVIRAQWAMDRGGGPIQGGPLMDTAAARVTSVSQPMFSNVNQYGVTGTLVCSTDDTWTIGAPFNASVDFAYCYMGIVPAGGDFFDLTVPRPDGSSRLNYFITEQMTPENLGFQGQNVPLLCNWMHTGATQSGAGGPYFAVNAPDGRVWTLSGGEMTAIDGPPIGA